MQISIASFSFHGALAEGTFDVFAYFEACRYRYHLNTADIWNGLLGSDPEVQLDPERLKKVCHAMNERDLVCVNYHADGCHPWEDDPEARQRHMQLAERHLEAGEKLGALTIRIDSGGRDEEWTEEQFEHIVAAYKKFAKRAENGGYKVGPETHWGATNFPNNMLKLAKAVDSPAFGILLHMGKETSHTPDEYDRLLAPLAYHTHVDQKTTYNRIDKALSILLESGYQGVLGVEHHTGKNELAEVEAQVALVRRALSHAESANPGVYGGNPLLDPKDERSWNR